ncbi:MAG TPA: HU family DNA-binding protein [Thermomicrobiales bacterium]|nr:HU family DNA-binding protein [Thermomicrobiales bacterium]
MRKQDLVKSVAGKTNMPERQVDTVVQATFDAIRDSLAEGEEVTITGFGSFRISERGAREGRNPQTGERITIPSRKSPSFRPGTQLKRAVGGE